MKAQTFVKGIVHEKIPVLNSFAAQGFDIVIVL